MSVRTRNAIGLLGKIDHALEVADKKHTFEDGLNIAREVIGLLGIEAAIAELKSFPRLKANPSWTKNAPDYEDRKASFALAENNDRNIDFKLYWVTKPAKRIISNLVALTPNFEDEAFYSNKSVGIDFILPDKADRLIVVLSSNYKIRILEIHRHLSNTQKKIFEKWVQDFDFSNKAQVHKILWDSFDIQPLNKEFYLEISSFFNELIQHLEKEDILDKKRRSQFVNRLIGRIIFCWFLRKKEIISEDVGYFDTDGKPATEYYGKKLEVLFFKVLNTPLEERGFGIDDKTPFLNGGLFEEKESDLAGRGELSFPPDYFERFYSFLNRYNFTTDESTSDFQQVAIDPEMLGCIFENLLAEEMEETGEQARKAKGAFYTPREIVDYMCRESLRAYVSEKLGDDTRKAEVLQLLFDKREHELDPKSILGKLGSYKNKIIEALDEIKIIDPACGSGAFPIGMLQIMLSIYERLDARLDHYKTKLTIIKNNIFGVDIEPMAVEISRLRTWLSLVVDSVIKPSEKNKGIEELPNLDFKFICANSLILLEQEEGLYDNKEMAGQMQAIRDRYFKTNSQRIKDKMKRDFEEILKKNQSMFVSQKQKQLLTYHPFSSDNVCTFFNSEFMFGVLNFDIVLANPPYIDSENMVKTGQAGIREIIQETYAMTRGNWDIYIAFFELGFKVMNPNGMLTFITPDKWISKPFGGELRKNKIDNIFILIRAGRKVFESAKVDSIISFFSNKGSNEIKILDYDGSQFVFKRSIKKTLLNPPFALDHLFSGSLDLIGKIEKSKNRVSDFSNSENACATSDAYKLAPFIKEISEDEFDQRKYLKIINTGTIGRFSMRWGIRPMTYLKNKYLNPVVDRKEFLTAFPNSYGKKAIQPKIILKGLNLLDACLDKDGIVIPGKTTLIIANSDIQLLKFLLAILNSRLSLFYIKERYPASSYNQGTTFTKEMIDNLPIPEMSEQTKKQMINIVDEIISMGIIQTGDQKKTIEQHEKQIDELIMELHGLTKEERSLINDSHK